MRGRSHDAPQNLRRLKLTSVFLFLDLTLGDILEKIAIHFCRTFPASELSLSPLAVRSPAAQEGRGQASDDVAEPEQRQFLRRRDCAEEICPVLGPRYL